MAPDARPEIGAFRDVSNARFWLQAAARNIVIYVRLTFSSRNSDATFPLLIVHRTHADEPWTAASEYAGREDEVIMFETETGLERMKARQMLDEFEGDEVDLEALSVWVR